MHNFRELVVWKKAIELTITIYKTTESFPKIEVYGITSQMRRAAISVSSNIAEGSGRGSNADFSRFLDMAKGSAFELETQTIISNRLGYFQHEIAKSLESQLIEIQKMITGLQRTLKSG